MKNKKSLRKALAFSVVAMGTAFMVSCMGSGNGKNLENLLVQGISAVANASSDNGQSSALINEESQASQLNGNTFTYGDHTYTVSGEIVYDPSFTGYRGTPTASVSFTNFPSGYTEFEAVYTNLLGKSIQGAAAMIPMAIELYARDAAVGERCFNLLCNSSSTVSGIIRILKTKLVPSEYGPANDPYLQRYMAAALLKGAMASNAYTPEEPYTVEMCASANMPQNSSYGTVNYVYILAKGWDTEQRQVEILQSGDLYKVFNCPSCYTQCKNIQGTWGGLK
ncbi:MAG: hypothetical protein J6X40_06330 [Bacteroidales bacterium]|jgi:hypothetical protein|nr:hypothetical protein [Bacteroidales bacterium]